MIAEVWGSGGGTQTSANLEIAMYRRAAPPGAARYGQMLLSRGTVRLIRYPSTALSTQELPSM